MLLGTGVVGAVGKISALQQDPQIFQNLNIDATFFST